MLISVDFWKSIHGFAILGPQGCEYQRLDIPIGVATFVANSGGPKPEGGARREI